MTAETSERRDREFFRRQVRDLLAGLTRDASSTGESSPDNELCSAVVLGYLRGSARSRTAEEHTVATLGAFDALDEVVSS